LNNGFGRQSQEILSQQVSAILHKKQDPVSALFTIRNPVQRFVSDPIIHPEQCGVHAIKLK
jgi:hypothetical protein